MRQFKDRFLVPIPTSIIKRIEGVFIANGCRYFTPEGVYHTQTRNYYIAKERTGSRQLTNLNDFWGWVQSNNVEKAIADELEPELTALNTTLWDWLNDNKVRRSEIVERE